MCLCHCSFTVVDGIFCVLLEVVLLEPNTVLLLRSVLQVSCSRLKKYNASLQIDTNCMLTLRWVR